ncbi:MAG: hypothetical protein K6G90_06465 [Clostridia bacterium]|nr:hypothetical protein [Clostridia bacterium]
MPASLVADISDVPLDRKITLHTKKRLLKKTKASTHPELTPCFFTLLPDLLFRKQVRGPDLLFRKQVRGPDLSSRKQAPASDLQFRRQAQESDLSFRKRRLQPFRRTWRFPPFTDSVYILPR